VSKLGLWASVRTRLGGQCGNWAWWPVWKLGLVANVEIGLGGQCRNWAWWANQN